ncbi:MAG: PorT family protein [Bacteroidales bacterium]|nr:PorT family protein [Bacteroidales bacterium]
MKKILAIITILISTLSASYAQDFGFRAGFNLAKHISDASSNTIIKPGLNLGLIVDINLIDDLYLRPGFEFTMKGNRQKVVGTEHKWRINQNYFQIPIDIAYKLGINKNFDIDFQAGPFMGIGFCGKAKFKDDNGNTTDHKTFKSDGTYKRFDFGLNFGAGVDIDQFYFGMGYDLSLLNLTDNTRYKQKNGVLMFNVGYNF